MKKVILVFLVFLVVGCNSVPKPPEPSGSWSDINIKTK